MTQGRHAEQGKGEEKEDCKVCTCMPDGRAKRSAKFGLGSNRCISEPWAAIKACPTQCPIPKTESQLGASLSLRARSKGWGRGNVLSPSRELISCCGGRRRRRGGGRKKKTKTRAISRIPFPFTFSNRARSSFSPLTLP